MPQRAQELTPHFGQEFKKQFKKLSRSGKANALKRAKELMSLIIQNERPLPDQFLDHALKGELAGSRDAHFGGDYVLIYRLTKTDVYFEGIGSHSELFN